MADEELTETLTKFGKEFCPVLRFEVTEQNGLFRLTDDKWSWSLYITINDMMEDHTSPLEWVRETFLRFNERLNTIRDGFHSPDEFL